MTISSELRWILVVCGVVLLGAIYWWGRRGERSKPENTYDRLRQDTEPTVEPDFESVREPTIGSAVDTDEPLLDADDDFDRTMVLDDIAATDAAIESVDWPEVRLHDSQDADAESLARDDRIAAQSRVQASEAPVLTAGRAPATADRSVSARASSETTDPGGAQAKTATQRKIIALRLAIGGSGLAGSELLELLQGTGLRHGKFGIFHRIQASASIFSVASMVEPGTFDLSTMGRSHFPGLTLFMLLPGPVDGLIAFDQMLSFAQRLAEASGGMLQDERGKPLTAHTIDRLRDEVIDFQHLLGSPEVVDS